MLQQQAQLYHSKLLHSSALPCQHASLMQAFVESRCYTAVTLEQLWYEERNPLKSQKLPGSYKLCFLSISPGNSEL